MGKAALTTANRTLRRLPNATYRPRKYLTEAEVDRLIGTARKRGRMARGMPRRSCGLSPRAPRGRALPASMGAVLLSTQDTRDRWHLTGGSMIAIDSLVHKFLHRTGILARCGSQHPYGLQCYSKDRCADIIEGVAERIDAREFNRKFPSYFPRYVQYAIWRFCAQEALDVCNSNRIDDRKAVPE
jgi:hypothetical protein